MLKFHAIVVSPENCDARSSQTSDNDQIAEVLVVLGVAALSHVDRLNVRDELDRLDPLDHLETELNLDAQPQRRPMQLIERLLVHFVLQPRHLLVPPRWHRIVGRERSGIGT